MDGIRAWIEAEGSGHWFFIAFPVCLLALLIWFKGRRVRFLIPSLLMTIVIVNPLFYRLWDQLGLYAYWRILWIVPVIPVLSSVVPMVTERAKKPWLKVAAAAAGAGAVIFAGTFLYSGQGGAFVRAANAAKLPDDVVRIADRLLELEERPRIIAQDPIGVYIRQYTGKINQLFGRDLHGHIIRPSLLGQKIHATIMEDNYQMVRKVMLDESYEYLISNGNINVGFTSIDKVSNYGIYIPEGSPRFIRERNEFGQVISVTSVDPNGKPIIGPLGYATALYSYDCEGNVSREFYLLLDGAGIGGVEEKYDGKSRLVFLSRLDPDGKSYINVGGFSAYKQTYDKNGKLVSRIYVDSDDSVVQRTDGYSEIVWSTDTMGVRNVSFYDMDGNQVDKKGINLVSDLKYDEDGWSMWMTPDANTSNYCFNIGTATIGSRTVGESYTCHFEIEFQGVSEGKKGRFRCATQGSADGGWSKGNIWNSRLMWIDKAPEDGVYRFESTCEIDEGTVDVSKFALDIRCDNWAGGSFRIRKVKIEKGKVATEWSPGV